MTTEKHDVKDMELAIARTVGRQAATPILGLGNWRTFRKQDRAPPIRLYDARGNSCGYYASGTVVAIAWTQDA
jgi:hypothetical protein